jgi:hypothetical protein
MATYREARQTVIAQLEHATLADGTQTFAEVSPGKTSGESFPCAVVTASDATYVRITAVVSARDTQKAELTMLDCAESACKALGLRGLQGSFDWTVERGMLYRTWRCYYSVF